MEHPDNGALVSVRARRDQVIKLLSERFASDALDMDELEERLDRAHRATTLAALDDVVTDLTPTESPLPAVIEPAPLAVVPKKKRLLAIFGGFDRGGHWRVPHEMRVVAVFGGVNLDFRNAAFGAGETHLQITAVMGGVNIVIPPGLAVECDGTAIFGGFQDVDRAPLSPDPQRPLLRITGLAVLGGLNIETRLPGEDTSLSHHHRDHHERRQLRHERRQLRHERRQLRSQRAPLPEARLKE